MELIANLTKQNRHEKTENNLDNKALNMHPVTRPQKLTFERRCSTNHTNLSQELEYFNIQIVMHTPHLLVLATLTHTPF
jgi:hypothetical protein